MTRYASCGKLYASDFSTKASMGDDIDPVTLAKPDWRRNSGVAEPGAEQRRMVTENVEAITGYVLGRWIIALSVPGQEQVRAVQGCSFVGGP